MNELSYLNKNGDTVFTSKYYKNRTTCCKSNCLHCPYGYTLKNTGVKLEVISSANESECKSIFNEYFNKDITTSNLLDSAFGKKETIHFDELNFKALSLKGFLCGIVELSEGKYKAHFLSDHFKEQGIDQAYIMGLFD